MSDHTVPDTLHISLFADGQPLPGGWVMVHLGTTKGNSHGLLAGPTDTAGRVAVPRHRVEELVQNQLTTSPMDYGGLEAWDGLITVEPLTRQAVSGVFDAIRIWDNLGSIETEENLDRLHAFHDTLERLSGAELTVTAGCEPTNAATVTTSVRRA
ncbi:MAG: hypothetical protein ABWY83_01450 [Actinomycetota bacterium]